MTYPTCYRCPLRVVDGVRCDLLEAKAKVLKGHGFTSAKWTCDRRLSLFAPGDEVKFKIYELWDVDGSKTYYVKCTGVVMRNGPRKALVCVTAQESDRGDDDQVSAPVMWLRHDGLTKAGQRRVVCIHCGKPKYFKLRSPNKHGGEDHEWSCRWGEAGNDLPCEYPEDVPVMQRKGEE